MCFELSIRKRLVLSNIAMFIIPIISFIVLEIILSIFHLNLFQYRNGGHPPRIFFIVRFWGMILIFGATNGLLSYFVSKSIIKPLKELSLATNKISEGYLDFEIKPTRNDEIGKLAQNFEQMRKNLKESSELQKKYEENRKELLANISHDLKTPITSIKGYVEGIIDGVANSPKRMERYIQTIYHKANDMDALIDELFLYSKLDLKRIPFTFEEVNINNYLKDIIEEQQFDIQEAGVKISYFGMDKSQEITLIDRDQLKRAITNIIQNSIKFMDKKLKQIDVQLREDDTHLTVIITDNGKGISNDAIPFIFDRFYRADPSRNRDTGGSGLGLAIVKRIVEEHGGEIWAESIIGERTSIFFTLKKVNY